MYPNYMLGGLLTATALVAGCISAEEPNDDATRSGGSSIIDATHAEGFPEAVLVDMLDGQHMVAACSGSMLAPRVVLTAGHCVHNFGGFRVTAPHASGQVAFSKRGVTFDWNNEQRTVDPTEHDVGLIFLDADINLPSYPELAREPAPDGAQILNVGRIDDGRFSTTSLFVGPPTTVRAAQSAGFPYDYIADVVIESGDSGGPGFAAGTHRILAVNSGAGGGRQVLARVDLLTHWIEDQMKAR